MIIASFSVMVLSLLNVSSASWSSIFFCMASRAMADQLKMGCWSSFFFSPSETLIVIVGMNKCRLCLYINVVFTQFTQFLVISV